MEPASIRYKNPGAMWGSALAIKWGAAKKAVSLKDGTGQGNNIAVFPTYVQGMCAQIDLWRAPRYRNKPFNVGIKSWSGGNNVDSYVRFVLKRVPGMKADTIINDDFLRSPMGIAFLKAQAWHEAGKPYPAPDADWLEAQRRVFGGAVVKEVKPKPVVKSKSIAAEVVSLLSLLIAYVTDVRFLLIVVAVVSLFVIYDRYRKGDLVGWFSSPKLAPVKRKRKK
jgi:hypothetical protein